MKKKFYKVSSEWSDSRNQDGSYNKDYFVFEENKIKNIEDSNEYPNICVNNFKNSTGGISEYLVASYVDFPNNIFKVDTIQNGNKVITEISVEGKLTRFQKEKIKSELYSEKDGKNSFNNNLPDTKYIYKFKENSNLSLNEDKTKKQIKKPEENDFFFSNITLKELGVLSKNLDKIHYPFGFFDVTINEVQLASENLGLTIDEETAEKLFNNLDIYNIENEYTSAEPYEEYEEDYDEDEDDFQYRVDSAFEELKNQLSIMKEWKKLKKENPKNKKNLTNNGIINDINLDIN
jgi:hypothetical protein